MSWRADVDSLAFQPPNHAGRCFIHRRAFVTLCGANTVEDCERYFLANRAAIFHAAAAKCSNLDQQANFHLNSRDIGRATRSLTADKSAGAI
jgi:hypothetical protein